MWMNELNRGAVRLMAALALVLLSAVMLPRAAFGQPAGIDPQAAKLLKASTAFMGGQKRLSADTRSTIEVVLASGQKIQFDNTVTMALQRPNKFMAKRVGDLIDQVFYYDGKSLTLSNPSSFSADLTTPPGVLRHRGGAGHAGGDARHGTRKAGRRGPGR